MRPSARHGCRELQRRSGLQTLLFCIVAVQAITRTLVLATSPSSLLSGQVTWEINKRFANGEREVTFTLLTAFEMDPNCKYTNSALNHSRDCISASDHGFLCVDQYQMGAPPFEPTETTSGAFSHLRIGSDCDRVPGPHTGKANEFEIVRTQHINGLNIVFGKLRHTVVARNETIVMIAYFQSDNIPVLPQCQLNISDTALPCALNVEDLAQDELDRKDFRLRTEPSWRGDGVNNMETYWTLAGNGISFPSPSQDAPLFEVYVRLCPTTGYHACSLPEVMTHYLSSTNLHCLHAS